MLPSLPTATELGYPRDVCHRMVLPSAESLVMQAAATNPAEVSTVLVQFIRI
jgi:hypothetical protein